MLNFPKSQLLQYFKDVVVKVYILYSKKFDRRYVGMTANVETRLKEHNNGKTKSTKAFVPWKVIYLEYYDSYEDARKREKYFKSAAGRRHLEKILSEDM